MPEKRKMAKTLLSLSKNKKPSSDVIAISITKDDIKRARLKKESEKIVITKENLFRPIGLLKLNNGQKVSRKYLKIYAIGHPNSKYELKYNNHSYVAVAGSDGKLKFRSVTLCKGKNHFEIVNVDRTDLQNQNLRFYVIFEARSNIYLGLSDPITGIKFSVGDDISGIVRCKKCGTFYYKHSILDCGNVCVNCQSKEFWSYKDKEFYQDGKS
jgi:hypothetical protein